ncbi:MAG: ATP-dependent helicase, partial [Rhodospirillaceae bacterium]|nr:ATP-dependent helicase [Rhodospirillaceae bacterium]
LSLLAANLIRKGLVGADQEILIVTLVNSAVNNFSARIAKFIEDYHLIPGMGYRVRTLHGLAHDIVRERPDLANLSNQFQIVDEYESERILKSNVQNWLREHPEFYEQYGNPEINHTRNWKVKKDWNELAANIARSFIRQAKDLQASPEDIRASLTQAGLDLPLFEMGADIYENYQRALNYRSAVDFDDLIRLTLNVLTTDPQYLERLQHRWPYILEDEAQDSSRIQEDILALMSSQGGNWVRVGDPNQAIFETFTTASPEYLRRFLERPDVEENTLPYSGRSTDSILFLANTLVSWSNQAHPVEELRNALYPAVILPTPQGDQQPNPPDNPDAIHLSSRKSTPDAEQATVIRSLKKWFADPDHVNKTAAILVPRNFRGMKIVEALKANNMPCIELLKSSASTRRTITMLSAILNALAEPTSQFKLRRVYTVVFEDRAEGDEEKELTRQVGNHLQSCQYIERYLWPQPGRDWLDELEESSRLSPVVRQELVRFARLVQRWQTAALLPIDQLVLTISQDLFSTPVDLALIHKVALVLEQTARSHPDWHLPAFCNELESITRNERKFLGFTDEDSGFDPNMHRGMVTVATIHKAKGLEWDRVYLLSVNDYDFPAGFDSDQFIAEKWFVRDKLNLPAEMLAVLTALLQKDTPTLHMQEGIATRQA